MSEHQCVECKFYKKERMGLTGLLNAYCDWVVYNKYNHVLEEVGDLKTNKTGECERFKQKDK